MVINYCSDPTHSGKAWLSTWFPGEVWIGGWANISLAAEIAFTNGWITAEDRDLISSGNSPVGGWGNRAA